LPAFLLEKTVNDSSPQSVTKECISEGCTHTFKSDPTYPRSFCDDCRARKLAEGQQQKAQASKVQHAETKAILKEKKLTRKEQERLQYNRNESCTKSEAKEILANGRNISQSYLIDCCYEMGLIAARKNKIENTNAFYWTYGVLSTLESLSTRRSTILIPKVEDAKAPNEVFRNQSVVALWDFGTSWRTQPGGHKIGFEEFKELRALKGDPLNFGNKLLSRDFHVDPHGVWFDFLPRPNIDALPEDYTQEDMKRVLASLSEIHEFLVLASRNSYKSAALTTLMLCFLVTYYDIRILVGSATTSLAKDFVKGIRKLFLVVNQEMSLFQQIFPEMCWFGDEGSVLSYECPAARLNLFQPQLSCSSLDSTVAGKRCDIFWADDLADNTNSDTPELRETTQRKMELMKELIEPSGFSIMAGTPYAPGDMYDTALQRNDANTEKNLLFRVDPIFTILDPVQAREVQEHPEKIYDVKEDQVRLLFPSRMPWGYCKRLLQTKTLKTFLQQQMCMFTGDDAGQIKLNFELEKLQAAVIQPDQVPISDVDSELLLCIDRAYSTKRFADRSSLSLTKSYKNAQGHWSLCLLWNAADRWTTSELAAQIVECYLLNHPTTVIIEKDPSWRDLADAIIVQQEKYGINIPIFWKPITQTRNAKVLKFKSLEGLLGTGRLTFVSGPWISALFDEFLWQDGNRVSTTSQKDDRIDSISTAALALPSPDVKAIPESQAMVDARERADEAAARLRRHEIIFGIDSKYAVMPTEAKPDGQQDPMDNPIYKALAPLSAGRPQPPKIWTFSDVHIKKQQ
jgi:hypothetical protein